jgi:serine/threonine protein kinase
MPLAKLEKGTLVGNRYKIGRRLGRGGMATVYVAQDTHSGRICAVKIVSVAGDDPQAREDAQRRFASEVVAVNEVSHRNVLDVRDFGFEDDILFLVMEYLEGDDLGTILATRETPLDIEYAADIMLGLCAGITAVHGRKVIHRDIKPGNIMLARTDVAPGWEVKVVDFGVSKSASMAADLTQDGKIVGTPLYLAPEQLTAEALPASDQYAIAMVLYHSLTRHHPYEGLEGLKLFKAIEKGDIAPISQRRPDVPEKLEQVIMRGLKVDPADRHTSVFDFGRQLLEFASPVGRQLYHFYYETPPPDRPRNTAMMSTTGVSVAKKIADGDLKYVLTTVQRDVKRPFEATTAVTLTDPTLKDVAPSYPTTTDGIPVPMRTPVSWKWSDSQESDGLPTESKPSTIVAKPGTVEVPLWKRREPWIASIAAAVVIAVLVFVGANRLFHLVTPAARPEARSSLPSPRAVPVAPVPSAPAAVTAPAVPAKPPVERPPTPTASAAAPKPQEEPQSPPKQLHRHHSHPAPAAHTVEWKDPAGNPIPSP